MNNLATADGASDKKGFTAMTSSPFSGDTINKQVAATTKGPDGIMFEFERPMEDEARVVRIERAQGRVLVTLVAKSSATFQGLNTRQMAKEAATACGLGDCGIELGPLYLAKQEDLSPMPFPIPTELKDVPYYAAVRLRLVPRVAI